MNLAAVWTLARREWTRFLRQPSRSLSAAASPLLLWLFIGTGLDRAFQPPGGAAGVGFAEYFFPGAVLLLVLYGALFANATVIQDRHEGFLQGVLVAPVGAGGVMLGKVLGGAAQGWAQAMLVLLAAPVAGVPLTPSRFLAAAGVLALVAMALTAVGFVVAWRLDSLQGFHSLMNLVLAPLWMLSGAFFPFAGAPGWLQGVMTANPLTYAMAALRRVLYPAGHPLLEGLPALAPSLGIVLLLAAAALSLGRAQVARGVRR